MVADVEARNKKRKVINMLNPIPKNGLFATLNANEVAGIIAGLPYEYQSAAYQIYFGTVNQCSTIIDETIRITAAGGSWVHCPATLEAESSDPM